METSHEKDKPKQQSMKIVIMWYLWSH